MQQRPDDGDGASDDDDATHDGAPHADALRRRVAEVGGWSGATNTANIVRRLGGLHFVGQHSHTVRRRRESVDLVQHKVIKPKFLEMNP